MIDIYDMTHASEVMRKMTGGRVNTLNSRMGTGGNQVPVLHYYTIAGNIIGRHGKNGGHQLGVGKDAMFTLNTTDRHAVAISIDQQGGKGQANYAIEKCPTLAAESHGTPHAVYYSMGHDGRVGSLCARDYKGIGNQGLDKLQMQSHTVRRLTPLECERLQGYPDGWTDIEFQGKPAPDTRRYKAIGNGMAQPCADFILRRIEEEAGMDLKRRAEE